MKKAIIKDIFVDVVCPHCGCQNYEVEVWIGNLERLCLVEKCRKCEEKFHIDIQAILNMLDM